MTGSAGMGFSRIMALPFVQEVICTNEAVRLRILSLVNQFGEGGLIPGEIACLAEAGVTHVVSVQPFGCIANHIVSKGVEKRIKTLYPDMSLLYLDFDAGTSEVNIRNRLYFMVEAVKAAGLKDCRHAPGFSGSRSFA